ncbi:hypothetical protein FEM48_Zijuj04G0088500 [Ziziphus jujuba var. spinosa]|uniref:Uncharacterized protein n=1 Tax=Ziziphus jujuba var. spinosa TaxID=714518 RepID=A0A978VIX8_ZIZJJ|nr:hypothetical protein FEM48_Zijuj04G0088500 [Ziziphus jujuba var. spinosa]
MAVGSRPRRSVIHCNQTIRKLLFFFVLSKPLKSSEISNRLQIVSLVRSLPYNSCIADERRRILIRNDVGFSLGTWMIFAANCKSRKIKFEAYLPDSDTFTLPLKVMQCSFLREMKINLIGGQLKVPWLDICSRIESLSLNCLCISTNDLKEWVISCKHLKKLNLFKLDLSSSSLKVLHIRNFIVNSLKISVSSRATYVS